MHVNVPLLMTGIIHIGHYVHGGHFYWHNFVTSKCTVGWYYNGGGGGGALWRIRNKHLEFQKTISLVKNSFQITKMSPPHIRKKNNFL